MILLTVNILKSSLVYTIQFTVVYKRIHVMCNTVMSGPVCPPLWDKTTYRLETIVSDVSMDPVEQCAFSSWKDIYSYSLAQHVSQVS